MSGVAQNEVGVFVEVLGGVVVVRFALEERRDVDGIVEGLKEIKERFCTSWRDFQISTVERSMRLTRREVWMVVRSISVTCASNAF